MNAGACTYYFHKDRLPKGWSYPLGRSVLDAALESAGITSVIFVHYKLHRASIQGERYPWLLRVAFLREDPASPVSGKVDITVYAVPSPERRATMFALGHKLAAICDWIRRTETAPSSWRMTEHVVAVEMRDHQARLIERSDL
jgi:hypothetical protein